VSTEEECAKRDVEMVVEDRSKDLEAWMHHNLFFDTDQTDEIRDLSHIWEEWETRVRNADLKYCEASLDVATIACSNDPDCMAGRKDEAFNSWWSLLKLRQCDEKRILRSNEDAQSAWVALSSPLMPDYITECLKGYDVTRRLKECHTPIIL